MNVKKKKKTVLILLLHNSQNCKLCTVYCENAYPVTEGPLGETAV